eukprot:g2597.t1
MDIRSRAVYKQPKFFCYTQKLHFHLFQSVLFQIRQRKRARRVDLKQSPSQKEAIWSRVIGDCPVRVTHSSTFIRVLDQVKNAGSRLKEEATDDDSDPLRGLYSPATAGNYPEAFAVAFRISTNLRADAWREVFGECEQQLLHFRRFSLVLQQLRDAQGPEGPDYGKHFIYDPPAERLAHERNFRATLLRIRNPARGRAEVIYSSVILTSPYALCYRSRRIPRVRTSVPLEGAAAEAFGRLSSIPGNEEAFSFRNTFHIGEPARAIFYKTYDVPLRFHYRFVTDPRQRDQQHADVMVRTATLELGREIDQSNVDLAFRVAKERLMRTEGLVDGIRAEFATATDAIGDVRLQLLEGEGNIGRNFDEIVRKILSQEIEQRQKSALLAQELAQQKEEGGLRAKETQILHSVQNALSQKVQEQSSALNSTRNRQQEQATISARLLDTLSALESKAEQLQSSSEASRRSNRSTPKSKKGKRGGSAGEDSSSSSGSESGSETIGPGGGDGSAPGGRARSNSFAFGSTEEPSARRSKGKRNASERRNSEPNVGERGTIGGAATAEHFDISDGKKGKRKGGLNPDAPAFTPDMAGMVTPGARTHPSADGQATPGAASSSSKRPERGVFVIGEAVTQRHDGQEIADDDFVIDPKYGLVGVLPKFTIELQSEYDLTGSRYSRKELDKTRLQWKEAQSMSEPFNTDNYATLRAWQSHLVEVISACLQGKLLKVEFEQSLISMIIMRDGHSAEQRALLYNTGAIAKEATAAHRFRNYFQALMIAFPKLTSDLATRVARWDHLNGTWMVSGADLVAELLRFATAAKGVGTQLNVKGPLAQMLLLRELAMRIKLPEEVRERVCQEKHIPIPTFEALLEYATRKKTPRTAIHLGNPEDKKKLAAANTLRLNTVTPSNPAATPTAVNTVGAGSQYYQKFGFKGGAGAAGEKEKLCKSCGVKGDHWTSECKLPKQCGACGAPGPPPGHSYDNCPAKHKNIINFTKFLRQNRGSKGGKGRGKGKKGGKSKVTARAFDADGNVVDEITLFDQEEGATDEGGESKLGESIDTVQGQKDGDEAAEADVAAADDLLSEASELALPLTATRTERSPPLDGTEPIPSAAPTLLTDTVTDRVRECVASVKVLYSREETVVHKLAEQNRGDVSAHLAIFDDDSGFTGMVFAGSRWVEVFLKFLQDHGVAVESESCAIEADTAGGVTTVVKFGVVPFGSMSAGEGGVAELIAVDDSEWAKEAAKLVGLKLKLIAGIDTDCSSEKKGVRWGRYFAPHKQYRLPIPLFDGLTPDVLAFIAEQQAEGQKLQPITKTVKEKLFGPPRVKGVKWGLDEWEEDEQKLIRVHHKPRGRLFTPHSAGIPEEKIRKSILSKRVTECQFLDGDKQPGERRDDWRSDDAHLPPVPLRDGEQWIGRTIFAKTYGTKKLLGGEQQQVQGRKPVLPLVSGVRIHSGAMPTATEEREALGVHANELAPVQMPPRELKQILLAEKQERQFWESTLAAKAAQERKFRRIYRKTYLCATSLPPADEVDIRAERRVVRNLDNIEEILFVDKVFRVKATVHTGHVINPERKKDLELYKQTHSFSGGPRSVVRDYLFAEGELHEPAMPLQGLATAHIPIKGKTQVVEKKLHARFAAQVRTPSDLHKNRIITMARGAAPPEACGGKSTKFLEVPQAVDQRLAELEGEMQATLSGIAPEAIRTVAGMAELTRMKEQLRAELAKKTQRIVIVGDGVLSAVAVGEALQDVISLTGVKRVMRVSLLRTLVLRNSRVDVAGRVRPWGVYATTPLQFHVDYYNILCIDDPRRSLSIEQRAVLAELMKFAANRGWTFEAKELADHAATVFQDSDVADVKTATEALLNSGLQRFREHVSPLPKVIGTWESVSPLAVGAFDTTFLGTPVLEDSEAFLNYLLLVEGESYGRHLGTKRKVEAAGEEEVAVPVETASSSSTGASNFIKTTTGGKSRGHPTGDDVRGFLGTILQFGKLKAVSICDPDPVHITLLLARYTLPTGRRVRILARNSPHMSAKMERRQRTWKGVMHKLAHDPDLRGNIPKQHMTEIAHAAISERARARVSLQVGLADYTAVGPESDSLAWWSASSIKDQVAVRAEHLERGRTAVSQLMGDPDHVKGIEEVRNKQLEHLRGGPFAEGQSVEFLTKDGSWQSGVFLRADPSNQHRVFVKPFGTDGREFDVGRRNVRPLVDTEFLLTFASRSVELQRSDLPHLEEALDQIRKEGRLSRVVGKFEFRTCLQCGMERAADVRSLRGGDVLCSELADTFCGDVSDRYVHELDGWIYPRKLKTGKALPKGLPPPTAVQDGLALVGAVPDEEPHVSFAPEPDVVDFLPEQEEAEQEGLGSDDGGVDMNAVRLQPEAQIDTVEVETSKDEPLPTLLQEEVEEDVAAQDLACDDFCAVASIMVSKSGREIADVFDSAKEETAASSYEEAKWKDEEIRGDAVHENAASSASGAAPTKSAPADPFMQFKEWRADQDLLDIPWGATHETAQQVCDQFQGLRGVQVSDPMWDRVMRLINADRRWFLDEVTFCWGAPGAKLDVSKSPHESRTCFGACIYVDKQGRARFERQGGHAGSGYVGVVRFEFYALDAICDEDTEKRMAKLCRPGMTAGIRKCLRSATKVPDHEPESFLVSVPVDDHVVEAMAKEGEGLLTAKTADGEYCMVAASDQEAADSNGGKLHSGLPVMPSRMILDIKRYSRVFVIIKIRWAPGGHVQKRAAEHEMEVSEVAAPTLAALETRMLLLLGNFIINPELVVADLPRAFNQADAYKPEERPRMKMGYVHSPRFRRCTERAFQRLSAKTGKRLTTSTVLFMFVPQCGVIEASWRFCATVVRKFRKQGMILPFGTRCIYRVFLGGKLAAGLGEHVDDFLGVLAKAVISIIMGKVRPAFELGLCVIVGEKDEQEGETFTGKQVFHLRSRQGFLMTGEDKRKELTHWESEEVQKGQRQQPERLLSALEIRAFRSVKGSRGYLRDQCRPDVLYKEKALGWGTDEYRTVQRAADYNAVADTLKRYPKVGLFFFYGLGSELVFLAVTDSSLQSRPLREKKGEDGGKVAVKNKGCCLTLDNTRPEFGKAFEDSMLPLSGYLLLVSNKQLLTQVAATKAALAIALIDWLLETGAAMVGSSFGGELEAHGKGMMRTEIVKERLADLLRPDPKVGENGEELQRSEHGQKRNDAKVLDIVGGTGGTFDDILHAPTYDLLDNTGAISRILSRAPLSEGNIWLYKTLLRSRALFSEFPRTLIHVSDRVNACDVLTKYFTDEREKSENFRELMSGKLHWVVKVFDKQRSV